LANVFITGGGGFLANHLSVSLLRDGHRVFALTRHRRIAGAPEGVRPVRGDLLLSKKALIPPSAEVVYHLAAKSSVVESLRNPAETFEVNAMGTARLLEEVRGRGLSLQRFVLASTGQVYGPPFGRAFPEGHPVAPRNPYSASKLAAESYAIACDRLYGIPVSALRLFNVYGPGQREEYVVPSVLRQCTGSKVLKIGNPWPVRDFVFVEDAVRLFRLVAWRAGARGEVINLGSGKGTAIADLVRLALKVTNADLKPHSEPRRRRANDFDRMVADISKALRLTGWRPRVGLQEGLSRTAGWMRKNVAP
jgi:nucleoside-diphosphate-sugar epimerase